MTDEEIELAVAEALAGIQPIYSAGHVAEFSTFLGTTDVYIHKYNVLPESAYKFYLASSPLTTKVDVFSNPYNGHPIKIVTADTVEQALRSYALEYLCPQKI